MAKSHRGGKLAESLLAAHRNMLLKQWQHLPIAELCSHLHRVVAAEHQRYSKVIDGVRYFGDSRLQPQLRWRRLAVAGELTNRGMRLNPLLFAYRLPHQQWPGLARLLGQRPEASQGHA